MVHHRTEDKQSQRVSVGRKIPGSIRSDARPWKSELRAFLPVIGFFVTVVFIVVQDPSEPRHQAAENDLQFRGRNVLQR
jgi:hypothetical protein